MGAIIGLIIFGAVIGVLARLVLPGKRHGQRARHGAARHCRGLDRLLDRGAAGGQAHQRHRLDSLDHHHRCGSDRRHRAEQKLRVSDLVDIPAHRSLLHPGADERDELAPEEQPIIAMP